ncbi:MAG: hypothetical protein ACLFU8_14655 [Anaerolineales bacterium]
MSYDDYDYPEEEPIPDPYGAYEPEPVAVPPQPAPYENPPAYTPPPPAQKKDNTVLIVILVVAALLILCCCCIAIGGFALDSGALNEYGMSPLNLLRAFTI